MAKEINPETERMWVRAFYGFNPEEVGYIGFSLEADRETMMGRMQDGDLVLIYGAAESFTDFELRRQALGFLEIQLERCDDISRMSHEAHQRKIASGFEERWTFGIKVRRAWRINNRVHIRTVAPLAYQNVHRFERTTRAVFLSPEERKLALSHTVRQVNVFGEPNVPESELMAGQMEAILAPSRGIPPSFGERNSIVEDGENKLYLMIFSEPAEFVLGSVGPHVGHALVKVGRTNDTARRLRELNGGLPSNAVFGWRVSHAQPLPNGEAAHDCEDSIKAIFAREFRSQAGEFFTGPEREIKDAFEAFCRTQVPIIRGAANAAGGVRTR